MKNEIYIPQVLKQSPGAENSSESWEQLCVCIFVIYEERVQLELF